MSPAPQKSYIIEFVRLGAQVKVTACDPETGIEASVVAPASASQKDLTDLAVRKLRYVLGKAAAQNKRDKDEPTEDSV